jgi:hypothetical protein
MHLFEQAHQLIALAGAESGEHFATDLRRDPADSFQDRSGVGREIQRAGPPIDGVRASLDPAVQLHAIEDSHQGHRLDVRDIGQPGLADSLIASQMVQCLALRQGQRQLVRQSLEALDVQARDVVQNEPEILCPIQRVLRYVSFTGNRAYFIPSTAVNRSLATA